MNIMIALGWFWLGGVVANAPAAVAMRRGRWWWAAMLSAGWPLVWLAIALGLVKFQGGVVEEA